MLPQYFTVALTCCFYCCAYSANGGARNFCYLGKANRHPQKSRFRVKRFFMFFIGAWFFLLLLLLLLLLVICSII